MAVYDFSVGVFRSEYPAFVDETKYPDTMITTAFPYDPPHNYFRKYLLDRATCHLLYMASLPVDQVGRVSSASQGSVSTSFDLPKSGNSAAAEFWNRTNCGMQVWLMLAPYRLGGRIYLSNHSHPWG